MKILRSILGVTTLLAATASHGVGQVVAGPHGPVEFVGLRSWNAPDLLEAIQRIDPDQPLHACAATMKSELGFPDAAVFIYIESGTDWSRRYTVIVGIEDSARVRYRTAGTRTIGLPEPWQALKTVAEEDFGTLVLAAEISSVRHDSEKVRESAEIRGLDPAALDTIWRLIDALNGEQDRLLAHELSAHDASWSARAAAVSVLVSFSEDDATWHRLVSDLIDPDGRVQTVAGAVLRGLLGAEENRSVRWESAHEPLMALLDGTNLFAFPIVLELLAATEIAPAFGRHLIRSAPDLLLAYVGAEHEGTRESAIDFLKLVSGEDFGANPEAWSEWLSRPPDSVHRTSAPRPTYFSNPYIRTYSTPCSPLHTPRM